MNPNQIISMLMQKNPVMQNNPMIQNVIKMAQANNTQGLQNVAQNLAKEKGIDLNTLQQQLKSNLQI